MTNSLLQKAKKIKVNVRNNKEIEDIEQLALAWVRDEIRLVQISKVLGLNNTGYRTYSLIALSLKKYMNENYRMTPDELKANSHKNYRTNKNETPL